MCWFCIISSEYSGGSLLRSSWKGRFEAGRGQHRSRCVSELHIPGEKSYVVETVASIIVTILPAYRLHQSLSLSLSLSGSIDDIWQFLSLCAHLSPRPSFCSTLSFSVDISMHVLPFFMPSLYSRSLHILLYVILDLLWKIVSLSSLDLQI